MKKKHGGKRKHAGRPEEPYGDSVVMRVPKACQVAIKAIIESYKISCKTGK